MPIDISSPFKTDGLLYVDGVCVGPFANVTDAPTVSLQKEDIPIWIFE